jgi:uncharacterized Fe-S cluster-containing MiaB family protein
MSDLMILLRPPHRGWSVIHLEGPTKEVEPVMDWVSENIGSGMPRWFTLNCKNHNYRAHSSIDLHIMRPSDRMFFLMAWCEAFEQSKVVAA